LVKWQSYMSNWIIVSFNSIKLPETVLLNLLQTPLCTLPFHKINEVLFFSFKYKSNYKRHHKTKVPLSQKMGSFIFL
jgi:hypothetical protein